MFCIKCGKRAEIGNFCVKCFIQKRELFDIEDFHLKICDCGSYHDRKWQLPKDKSEVIREQIEKRIKTENKIIKKEIKTKEIGNTISANISCCGLILPERVRKCEERRIRIILKRQKCNNCVKLLGGYYEALFQIRGKNSTKILDRVKKLSKNNLIRINRVENGYDISFMTKSAAREIIADMKRNFTVRESFKFITTKKGKRLYRNYYSIR